MKRALISLIVLGAGGLAAWHFLSTDALLAESKKTEVTTAESKTTKEKRPQVVAEINETKITRKQLEMELGRQLGAQLQSMSEENKHKLEKQFLSKIVERELLQQAASTKNTEISKEQIDTFIDQLKTRMGSEEAFQEVLKKNQLDDAEFRKGVKQDLMTRGYIEKVIFEGIAITDDEVKKTFEASPEQFKAPPEVRARHILFKIANDAEDDVVAKVESQAKEVLKKAKANPKDFEALAREHSEGPTRDKGGDLGYFTKNQMVKPFADSAFSLEPGAISDLVRTRFGFHIIKVEDTRGGETPEFEKIKDGIKGALLRKRREEALLAHVEELKKSASVIMYLN